MNTYKSLYCSATIYLFGLHSHEKKKNAEVETCPDMFKYKCWLDSLPLRHAAVIPGIKLSHLVYIKIIS